jgi:bacteriorhodopsin
VILILVGLTGSFGAWRAAGWIGASTAAIVSLVAIAEMNMYRLYWWHTSVGFALFMLPGAFRTIRHPARIRQLGLILILALDALVWGDHSGGILGLLSQFAAGTHPH